MTAKYTIYQITDKDARRKYGFMDYEYAQKHGFSISDYTPMWRGYIECDDEQEACELLFRKFNTAIPENFTGHSMSVSDVIAVDGNFFYCSNFGFVQTAGRA